MGVFFEIVDFDEEFKNVAKEPTILNDLEERTEKDKEFVNRCIYTHYTSDLLSNIPSCSCGALNGEAALGLVCPECNTYVVPSIEEELEPLIWIRAPAGVHALINPTCWSILSARYTKSNFNALRYICDITYNPSNRKLKFIEELRLANLSRGYNYFIDHFDEIIETLNNLPSFRMKRNEIDTHFLFIQENRDKIFCQHIPILNKSILVFEDGNQGNFVDASVPGVVNAARIMVGIDVNDTFTQKMRENRTIKAIVQLTQIYESMNHDGFLSSKSGLLRKHAYGGRSFFSFRAVISSMTDPHYYREIHIPWSIGVSVFTVHIKNALFKMGMTANEATSFIFEHTKKYSELIDKILKNLIDTSPFPNVPFLDVTTGNTRMIKGVACTAGRNPSLKVNSMQLVYITKVKPDVTDVTVSLPILSVHPYNAKNLI